jgi:hypothetical protein
MWLFPAGDSVTISFVVSAVTAANTMAGAAVGSVSRYSAATPAAWGDAMEVPL